MANNSFLKHSNYPSMTSGIISKLIVLVSIMMTFTQASSSYTKSSTINQMTSKEEIMAEVFPEFHRQSSLLAGQHPKL